MGADADVENGQIDEGQADKTTPTQPRPSSLEKAERTIATRGIPSEESMYLPPHDSPVIRSFQDGGENPTRNMWDIEEVVTFVFPRKYQAIYHSIAVKFLRLLVARTKLEGAELADFISKNNISKATFYNRVLPRLRRVGMIKIERHTIVAKESLRKYRPMTIHLGKTFGNYLMKIGDSWLAIVDEARSKYDQQKRLGHFEGKE